MIAGRSPQPVQIVHGEPGQQSVRGLADRYYTIFMRSGAAVARVAHNHEVAGANPASATKSRRVAPVSLTGMCGIGSGRRAFMGSYARDCAAAGSALPGSKFINPACAAATAGRKIVAEKYDVLHARNDRHGGGRCPRSRHPEKFAGGSAQ